MHLNIEIVIATAKDADVIAQLSRQTFYETFAPSNTKEDMDEFLNKQFTYAALVKEVTDSNSIFLLAYDNEEAIGYARLRNEEQHAAFKNRPAIEIARIYALQKYIGRGVGKALILQCFAIAKKTNKQIIWLGVWQHNIKAIEFYKKFGFTKFGEHAFLLGNDLQTDWLMMKELDV
jgi:diamine N-acetyltransferase